METSGIVLDTDVIVSDLRGKTSVLRTLEGKDLATTVVNAFESFHGAFKSRESDASLSSARGLLANLRVLGLDKCCREGG